MQMKRKRCHLFKTTPGLSITDLEQSRIVHFIESGKHAKPACTFSAASLVFQ